MGADGAAELSTDVSMQPLILVGSEEDEGLSNPKRLMYVCDRIDIDDQVGWVDWLL